MKKLLIIAMLIAVGCLVAGQAEAGYVNVRSLELYDYQTNSLTEMQFSGGDGLIHVTEWKGAAMEFTMYEKYFGEQPTDPNYVEMGPYRFLGVYYAYEDLQTPTDVFNDRFWIFEVSTDWNIAGGQKVEDAIQTAKGIVEWPEGSGQYYEGLMVEGLFKEYIGLNNNNGMHILEGKYGVGEPAIPEPTTIFIFSSLLGGFGVLTKKFF